MKANVKKNSWLKETCRKMLVTLKKNPQLIPLLALTVSVIVFTFNLTDISNTTAKIYGKHMGLSAFVSMLFSILSYVCMFSAFPKRQKPNWLLIGLMFAMYAAIIFADSYYIGRINYALTRPENPIVVTEATQYIYNAEYIMTMHIATVVITMVTVVLEPVFAKLLKKINTSIEVEGNDSMEAIDLAEEE